MICWRPARPRASLRHLPSGSTAWFEPMTKSGVTPMTSLGLTATGQNDRGDRGVARQGCVASATAPVGACGSECTLAQMISLRPHRSYPYGSPPWLGSPPRVSSPGTSPGDGWQG